MFVLNAYFCRELRFVAILCSKLRFLLRNTKVDPEFLRKKLAAEGSATNPMPGLSTSFEAHAFKVLGVELTYPAQPMLRIANAKRRDHMLLQGGEPEADGKPRSYHSFRAPELLGVEPLCSGLWRQAQALPWLMHRIEGLLHALSLADLQALPADMVLAQVGYAIFYTFSELLFNAS